VREIFRETTAHSMRKSRLQQQAKIWSQKKKYETLRPVIRHRQIKGKHLPRQANEEGKQAGTFCLDLKISHHN